MQFSPLFICYNQYALDIMAVTRKKTNLRDVGDVASVDLDLSRLFFQVHTCQPYTGK